MARKASKPLNSQFGLFSTRGEMAKIEEAISIVKVQIFFIRRLGHWAEKN